MNTRKRFALAALALCGFTGLAQASDVNVEVVPYQYGMRLDVAKVISMTEPPTSRCEVVTANMRYINKAGELAEISYQKHAHACLYEN
ncbi:DUF2790 domain-containing protein [Pseudomonas saponiphila]|uniref:DUF2790 domain-containing protein n=1 Tax=Pseudomonas saponiphila TaxID=556534 RepID=A0A1H4NT86_9PSED|nr:DUF2790 domain-containing protein [Pseudomonas saponiphila]SEB98374.1 Protein of unknown function [Pseudomonas saponiphila]